MGAYDFYSEIEFEPFEVRKPKKKKKVKKFFKKLGSRVIGIALSTISQMALRWFDKKLKMVFA